MAVVALGIIGAVAGYAGQQSASDAATSAQQTNLGFQQQYNLEMNPFAAQGQKAQYVPMLNQLVQGGYQGLQNDPMYKQLRDIGTQGVERYMSSHGMGVGTTAAAGIEQSQQKTMMDYFNQKYNMLAELSGLKQGMVVPQGMDPLMAGKMAYAPYQTGGEMLGSLAGLYHPTTTSGTEATSTGGSSSGLQTSSGQYGILAGLGGQ